MGTVDRRTATDTEDDEMTIETYTSKPTTRTYWFARAVSGIGTTINARGAGDLRTRGHATEEAALEELRGKLERAGL